MKEIELFTPVFVIWIDSMSSTRAWMDVEDFGFEEHTQSSKTLTSIGFVVNMDEDNLFLSDSISAEEKIMYGCMSIPIVAIKEVIKLEVNVGCKSKKKPKGK
jgi:hypothetical protein